MNRIRDWLSSKPAYEPIDDGTQEENASEEEDVLPADNSPPFSWIEYSVFFLLGVAMLWAWNMFFAAAPYFQHRFQSNDWIFNHFQPAEISVSTVTNLGSMIILTRMQKGASYPRRISTSLLISTVVFALLAVSTQFRSGARPYFGFLLVTVFSTSLATGLIQNGLFSFTSGYGRSEYMQAIMTGQAVAGVLPPLAQMISVAAYPEKDQPDAQSESSTSAMIYFLTATIVSILALGAFFYVLRRRDGREATTSAAKATFDDSVVDDEVNGTLRPTDNETSLPASGNPSVPFKTLWSKLTFLALAVFFCFAITMVFPVFTASIRSVSGIDSAVFIPLAFLVWNTGDLLGRLLPLSPKLSLTHYPFALFCMAMARFLFIPLYFLCNIKDRGATVNSDVFYLVIVQFLFGLTNGYVGSSCMMGAADWVSPEEREAAGGFMGLILVCGLTVGSLMSFALGDV